MQEILVRTWDDREMTDSGKRVESEQVVIFEYGGKRWKLDLTNANAARFDTDMIPWINAAHPADAPQQARFGFKPGGTEARAWRRGLREWAELVGRGDECCSRTTPGGKVNWRYTPEIENDYQKHLLDLARAA